MKKSNTKSVIIILNGDKIIRKNRRIYVKELFSKLSKEGCKKYADSIYNNQREEGEKISYSFKRSWIIWEYKTIQSKDTY